MMHRLRALRHTSPLPLPLLLLALCQGLSWGCGTPSTAGTGANNAQQGALNTGPAAVPDADTPQLVVSVVFDQMGSDTLQQHLALLDEDGAIRRCLRDGASNLSVRYGHPATFTAPDHAALYTGETPRKSGIVGNAIRHADGNIRAAVNDGSSAVHGAGGVPLEGRFASPKALRVPAIGDALKAQYGDAAKVIAISLKDRGAILPGGHRPDAAVWFEPTLPGFTSSSYYGKAPPAWVTSFMTNRPLSALLVPWQVEDAAALASHLGSDAQAGEGALPGLGNAFPHDPGKTQSPYHALRMMPALSEYLLDLAEHATAVEGLGADAIPDLLAISISGTDYAGHTYGPRSWEYVDHLKRADRALGKLIERLSARTRLSLVITSDHGVMRLPEQLDGSHSRLRHREVVATAEVAMASVAGEDAVQAEGPTPGVEAFVEPYVYFDAAARAHPKYPQMVAAVQAALSTLPQVHAALDAGKLARGAAQTDLERDVASAVHPEASGDVYVVPAVGEMTELSSLPGAGTTHGSPWDYDRIVPGLAWGTGVPHKRASAVVSHRAITATLQHLLALPATTPPLWH